MRSQEKAVYHYWTSYEDFSLIKQGGNGGEKLYFIGIRALTGSTSTGTWIMG